MSLAPIHQLVLNGSTDDVGSSPSGVTSQGVSYINYEGKDCVYINSDSVNPAITIPYVVSNTDSFTLSFWMYAPFTPSWNLPVGLDDGSTSIITVNTCDQTYLTPLIGVQGNYIYASLARTGWDHYVITYSNNNYIIYLNNVEVSNQPHSSIFTSTRINIGGNNAFSGWNFGEQTSCIAYIRQICLFDSALNVTQVSELYTQTQNNTILGVPPNPLTPTMLAMSLITNSSFTVSWSGATGATSYTYTLNGSAATPSSETSNSATFTELSVETTYAVIVTAVSESESQASSPKNVTTLPNAPSSITLSTDSTTSNRVIVSWTGGSGATSYSYTLNGSAATPSSSTDNTARFSGLTPSTAYTLVITAINAGGQSSSSVTTTTLDPPPFPVATHQLILNGSSVDTGIEAAETTSIGDIVYTNYGGKDCLSIMGIADGNPSITMPCVFTEESSFTIGFWLFNVSNPNYWYSPISLHNETITMFHLCTYLQGIIFFVNGSLNTGFQDVGAGTNYNNGPSLNIVLNDWNHFTITYESGTYSVYINGIFTISFYNTPAFTSAGITIGDNYLYTAGSLSGTRTQMYIRQLCVFDSVLSTDDIATLSTLTEGNTNLGVPPNPLKPYNLTISLITTTSFTLSWLGGVGAAAYTYTLNGSPVTPSIDNGLTNNTATFTDLIAGTSYTIIVSAVSPGAVEIQASSPKNLTTLPNPPVKPVVSIGVIIHNAFVASWTGGEDATSYIYALNAYTATPSSTTANSATFSGLTASTAYTLVITAINAGGQTSADPVSTTTLEAPPFPIATNQLILNGSSNDTGSQPGIITSEGDIVYTNYEGKECMLITKYPYINVPCVFSNQSSFTISFWIYNNTGTNSWQTPFVLGDTTNAIITVGITGQTVLLYIGNHQLFESFTSMSSSSMNLSGWNNITIRYDNNNYSLYVNGEYSAQVNHVIPYNTYQLRFGNNSFYTSWSFGDQFTYDIYIRQVCVFDSALTSEDIATLYTLTQNNTSLGVPANPLKPYNLTMSLITQTSFKVSWLGATGATSYIYTLNGSPATPSSETSSSATFTGLSALTAYSVVVTAVNADASESQASGPKSTTTLPNPPLKPIVSVTSQTYNSFAASWTGGEGATSYSYTLNGSPATPSVDNSLTAQVTFSGLSAVTSYTLVITAINAGGQTAADPVTTETLETPPFPLATHQFISNTIDVGSQSVDPIVEDPNNAISYTTMDGKECIYINSDGTNPRINIPVVFTETTPFTLSFWIRFDNVQAWDMPITINGSDIMIGPGFSPDYINNVIGNGASYGYNGMPTQGATPNNWSHIVITYYAGSVKTYFNGNLGLDMSAPSNFTTSQITIGGNWQYQGYSLGGLEYWNGYVRQICVFESALTAADVATLYILTDGNTVLGVPPNPLRPSSLLISTLTQTSFTVSWSGATGATSYTYTLNGSPATPSTDNGLTTKSATFTGLDVFTDYTLVVTAVADTESQASNPKDVKTLPNPPTQPIVSTDSITYRSFVASWTGASGAISYTYTLNGSAATPSDETSNSATFTLLEPTTSYTLVVTAVNIGGETASSPAIITTLAPPPLPLAIHQLVLNNSSTDIGTQSASTTEQGVTYITFQEKDCVTFTDAVPRDEFIKFPCVLTEESSFTISFWAFNTGDKLNYYCPIILDNGTDAIIMFRIWNNTTMLIVGSRYLGTSMFGTGPFYDKRPGNIIEGGWNNYTLTYLSGIYTLYTNGVYMAEVTDTNPFTSTHITIGDNEQYTWWTFGQYITDMYIRQICVFDSALNAEQITSLYIQSQGYTIVGIPSNPLSPYNLTISSITTTSFTVSWTGGEGATSYTYTLNDSTATPSTQTSSSATFSELSGATSYTLVITAVNSSGQTPSTPAIITTLSTLPTAPIIATSDITYNSFVASWTGGEGATSYTYTLNGSGVTPSSETSSSATFTSLSGSTEYTLVITAVNDGGQTSSEALLVTTLSNPPTAPSVSISSITYQSFVASWTGAIGATSYSYKLNGTPFTPDETGNSATFTSLSGSSAYILVVSAINNGGQTDSEFISITTLSTPPTAPIVTTDSITYESFVASWTGGERATSYIYTLNGASATPLTQTSNSATFALLNGATNYTLVVTAVNNGGQTASEPVDVRTFSIPPTAPIIATSSITYQSFVASWTGALGASSYVFTLNGSVVVPPIQTGNSATFISLNGATDYTLVITAVNNGGQAASDPATITTLPNLPTAPSVTVGSITYSSFVASWTGGEGAIAYKYKLNGSIVVPSSQTSSSATFAALNAVTSYTLIIEAINAGGKTVSEPVMLTTIVAPPDALSLSTNTITYQSFVASWTGGSGAASYTYMLNGATAVPSTDNSLTSKTVIFSSLNAATSYTLIVTAVNDGGQVNSSATARTLSAPPLDITVSVNTITYQSFVASWVGGEGATSYAYKLNGSTVTPSSQTTSSATFSSLSPATSYTLIVVGITDGGETSSAPVNITTFSTPPTAPIVAKSDITYQSFVASWTGADRATSYSYTLNGSIVVPSTDNGITGKSATFSALSAATSYTLVVTAVNNGGQTSSTPVELTTFSTPPTIPNVSTSAITYKSFVASWTGGSGATSYSYTLNGLSVVPSTNNGVTGKTATFTGLSGSTDYTLIVTAVNNGGQTSSSSVSITTLAEPAMALSVSTSAITYQSFVASWTGGSGATSYTYTLNGTPTTPSIDNGLTSKSATFSSLNAATIYTLIVTAVNGGGQTSSTPVELTTFSTPPTAPSVTAGSITYSSFLASWTGGVGATSYIYRLNGLTVVPSTDNGLTSKSASFATLNAATSYTLIITAVNNGGQAVSTPVAITTFSTPPTTPILAQGSITYESFAVSWTGGVRATSYIYTLNGSPVTPFADNGLTTQVALFSGLSAATNYTVVVTAVNNGGSTSSEALAVTTFNTPPTAPIFATSSITSQSFVASWTGGSPATSYIYKLNGIPIAPSVDNGLTSKSATFASLTPAASYTLIVIAVNNNVQTASDPLVITTLVAPPTVLSVSTGFITYQSFVASWTGGSGATSYTYTLNGAAATPSTQTSNSATFTELTAATSYTVVITAVNNGGQTVSAPLGVTTLNQPPTAPSVTAGSITHSSFLASWTGGVRATSYRYTLNGANITPFIDNGVTSQSATFSSLNGATSYTLVITAMNNGGQISSDALTITTPIAPPTAPIVTAASITSQSFVASWTGGDRATSYRYTLNGSSVTPIDNGLTNKAATFASLNGATSYTLIVIAVNDTAQISSFPIVVTTLTQPPTAPTVTAGSITYQSFVVSWTGGSGASSYTYTLNGAATTPLTQTSNSATFTPLSASTSYTLVVTAINNGGQTASAPLVITTLTQQAFPLPVHQLVLSDSDDDTGSAYVDVVVTDPANVIVYSNNGGKDCMHIVSDGTNPRLSIPCIFTETSSFTFSFWIKFDTINAWGVPITMNGANININVGFNSSSSYISVGNGVATSYDQNNIMTESDFLQWNHITLTYRNGTIKAYKNGVYGGSLNFTQAFTTSQITLGGNFIYQSIGLSGQAAWDGYLRQVCVFDSVLNGNDILQLYAKTQDNTVIGIPSPKVTKLKETFNNTTTVQSATSAINAALATNTSVTTVVAAALATASPTMFTALVTNPVFIGTTVTIPSSVATVLYASFEDKSTLDTSLPFKINFPEADGKVTPPALASNSKLAIDLTVDTYVSFKGCTGYGIHVVGGQQYFTTPSNPVGTLVHVGDILTFTIDAGATGSFKVADLDIVLIPYTPPTVICFLGSAPVLTPSGYSRIDTLAVGDIVCTKEGDTTAVIEKVEKQEYMPGRDTNPYIIPAGRFGSNGRILISPRHKVAVDGEMIEARFLGLEQEEQYEKIRYYNIQVTNCDNIIVAGLEVESLQLLTRVNIPMDTFNYIVTNKYDGKISDEIKAGCRLMADGTMSVPMSV